MDVCWSGDRANLVSVSQNDTLRLGKKILEKNSSRT